VLIGDIARPLAVEEALTSVGLMHPKVTSSPLVFAWGPARRNQMQRNLRPPLFTSMNLIALLHFGQVGGWSILGQGTLALVRREHNRSLCHR
jgi:hypothetical protein